VIGRVLNIGRLLRISEIGTLDVVSEQKKVKNHSGSSQKAKTVA